MKIQTLICNKKRILSSCISIFIAFFLMSCDKEQYNYLDSANPYIFKNGDTIIYKGNTIRDTFIVTDIHDYWEISDKKYHNQIRDIKVSETGKNCEPYCWGFEIVREGGNNNTSIQFRNLSSALTNITKVLDSYKIGTIALSNVYYVDYASYINASDTASPKNLKAYYYTRKYGIIAYDLLSGEKIEIDEKFLK